MIAEHPTRYFLLSYHARYYDPALARFLSAIGSVTNQSGGSSIYRPANKGDTKSSSGCTSHCFGIPMVAACLRTRPT